MLQRSKNRRIGIIIKIRHHSFTKVRYNILFEKLFCEETFTKSSLVILNLYNCGFHFSFLAFSVSPRNIIETANVIAAIVVNAAILGSP